MNEDPRYVEPNRRDYPPVTRKAILPFYLKLVHHFGNPELIPVGVLERRIAKGITTGRIDTNRRAARTCWASTKPTTGHNKGWGRMIHDASHYVFEKRHPSARPHDGGHAALEREMVEYVERKGWAVPKAPKLKARPTYAERIEHVRELIDRWERKAKRAETAMRKLRRRVRAMIRAQAKTNVGVSHANASV